MRLYSLALCLACSGCFFHVDRAALPDDGAGAATSDAAAADDLGDLSVGDDADLAAETDLAVPFCAEPSLVACWQFEDGAAATVAHDGSVNRNDLTLSGGAATSASGHLGAALSIPVGGVAHVAHNATFDVAQVTVEAWIDPTALPAAGARFGILDEDGQFGMFVYSSGVLTCAMSGGASSASNTVVAGVWQHVACTYDQQNVRVYHDGVQVGSQAMTAALPMNQANGTCIGSNSPSGDEFAGLLDDVRIFSVARSAAQICADYGGGGC